MSITCSGILNEKKMTSNVHKFLAIKKSNVSNLAIMSTDDVVESETIINNTSFKVNYSKNKNH